MADFYSGPNQSASFSQGLMAGYEFVDNIRARRQAEQDRQRQISLQEEQMGMQRETFDRQKTEWGQRDEDRQRALAGERDQKLGRLYGSIALIAGGPDKLSDEDRAEAAAAARAANPALANADDAAVLSQLEGLAAQYHDPYVASMVQQRRENELQAGATEFIKNFATELEAQSSQAPSPQPSVPSAQGQVPSAQQPSAQQPSAQQPSAQQPSAQPAPPQNLAAVGTQVAVPQLPSDLNVRMPGGAGLSGVAPAPRQRKIPTAADAGGNGADGSPIFRSLSEKEITDAVAKDPAGYAKDWIARRGSIKDDSLRTQADEDVARGLQEAYDRALTARESVPAGTRDRAIADRALHTYATQLEQISKTRVNEVAKAATANGPARGDGAVAAVSNAAAAHQTAGPEVIDYDKYRAMTQAANSAATRPGRRLTEVQIKNMGWMVSHGMLNMQQVENKMRYGTFEKPDPPTLHNFNNGYGAIIRGDKITYVQLPGGVPGGQKGGADGGKLWAAEYDRSFTNLRTQIAEAHGLDPKDDKDEIGEMLNSLITGIASDPMLQSSFTDPQGRIRFDQIGAEQAGLLVSLHKEWYDGKPNALKFWAKKYPDYSTFLQGFVAEQRAASSPAPANDGWSMEPVQ